MVLPAIYRQELNVLTRAYIDQSLRIKLGLIIFTAELRGDRHMLAIALEAQRRLALSG